MDVNTVKVLNENSDVFITGGDDGIGVLWDTRISGQVGTFIGHQEGIVSMSVSSDD